MIATLCEVKLVPYPLVARQRWALDLQAMEQAITPRTRAIILISPHNPTGAVATASELEGLGALALRHSLLRTNIC